MCKFSVLLFGGRWKRSDSRTLIKVRIKQGLCHIPRCNIHALEIHLNLPCILSRPSPRRLCCVGWNLLREVSAWARLCSAAPRAPEMLIILCNRFLKNASSCSASATNVTVPERTFKVTVRPPGGYQLVPRGRLLPVTPKGLWAWVCSYILCPLQGVIRRVIIGYCDCQNTPMYGNTGCYFLSDLE